MKKIALIMDGWKRWFTFAWPAGILQRIRQTGEEVSLYIFNSSGGWSCDEEYNTGEYNIYRLPDLREFDGIILDLNNIGYPEVWEDVYGGQKSPVYRSFPLQMRLKIFIMSESTMKKQCG